ncbi:MAG: diaminopimelate decarboxylase [Solirubrobacteraceae bacterium]|nr:diaminopimelate decarboxylase [Solirubrobacteraceae bacterium]
MTVSSVYPQHSSVEDGRLSIGGCDAVELAREFGTPAYVVAEDDLRARADEFTSASHARIVYASKAFPCTAALRLFADLGLGVDVASGGELHLALAAGFDSADIILHGNAKSEAELRMAVDAGVGLIVIDGHDAEALTRLGVRGQRCLIRVVPGVEADTHESIMTGHAESKFGLLPAEAAALIADPPAGVELAGLHFHLGSQIFDAEPFAQAVRTLAGLGRFPVYDLGGGMAVAYTREDDPPSPADWVRAVTDVARDVLGTDAELLLEPGRALVANAGVTLYTVQDVKRDFVAVDGGMSDNLRPMLYAARYEAVIADRVGADGDRYQVVGKHCESTDVLIRDAFLPAPRRGDVLVTPATGAYGHAMANNYNGIPRPPVIFCRDGDARVVVRRETYEDLTARDQP